ncbi:MAG: hypothetical protein KatS3mg109_0793 [Pirellulaceae bacterium]|nr:MAG: hypothetical protein KatS3mg109_0793 [Pirellulaceae bacterium]
MSVPFLARNFRVEIQQRRGIGQRSAESKNSSTSRRGKARSTARWRQMSYNRYRRR